MIRTNITYSKVKALSILCILLILLSTDAVISKEKEKSSKSKMVLVSSGYYIPLYSKKDEQKQKVNSFYIDAYPVTNEEFLSFVKANEKWRKSNVKKIFADKKYLSHWKSDLELGEGINPKSPVVNISWFAAKAYSEWVGKRLPTTAEWEYTAAASKTRPDAYDDEKNIQAILKWYSERSTKPGAVGTAEKNYWGVYDMFGLVWEWTSDFNTALVTGESREDASLNTNLFCGSGADNAKDVKNYPAFMRYGFRSSLKGNYTVHNLGFRCAKDIENNKTALK